MIKTFFPSGQKWNKLEGPRELNASETLDIRYARGEINREEYKLKKGDVSI